jgi:hypothetical protein
LLFDKAERLEKRKPIQRILPEFGLNDKKNLQGTENLEGLSL